MKFLARLRSWGKAMTRRSELDGEMQDELQFHIDNYADDLVRGGLTREAAQRRARIELGSVEVQKEECRESLGLRLWDDLLADLRYGLRMLWKTPGFTIIAVSSLALGIGANTIVFTLAKESLIDMLNVPQPQQLRLLSWRGDRNVAIHNIWGDYSQGGDGIAQSSSFSYPVYQFLRDHNQGLQDLFAFKDMDKLTAVIDGNARMVTSQLVSGNFYRALGVSTALGRPIQDSDDAVPGAGAVAVISDRFWAEAFGRSPTIVGKTIRLNLTPVTIIGVNPPKFTGAGAVQLGPDVFVPFSMQPVIMPQDDGSLLPDKDHWWMQIMGRVKPGVSDAAVRTALSVSLEQASRSLATKKDSTLPWLLLLPGSRGLNQTGRYLGPKIAVLLAFVGLVLLLACSNIANLLLSRSAARQREVSVRMALGASRNRVLRQVFTESLLLSLLGGAAGLLLGYLGRDIIPRLLSNSWERSSASSESFDWKVFAFTAAISVFTGLLFGLAPALQSTRNNVSSGLKDNATTATKRRKGLAGKAIVVFQVSLSMLLVVGAGLFARTLFNLGKVDIGFRPQNILLFHIEPPQSLYAGAKGIALNHQIEERLAAVPGVESVALSQSPLLADSLSSTDFIPDGQPRAGDDNRSADVNAVGQGFLSTMGIPVLAGRDFDAHDTESSPKVAIINSALARKAFPNGNPIGKTFKNNDRHILIVGVCGDARFNELRGEMPPTFYLPYRQLKGMGGATYELRLRSAPEGILPAIRAAVASVDRDLPLIDVRMQTEQIDAILSQERLFASLTGAFGVLALILACIGIYGVMAYNVARRINEIGIRIALGAQANQVLRMVLGEASLLAIFGVGIGLGCALWLTRFLESMLYGLKPSDPATLIGAALLLLATALIAGWAPAWRASRVQPMEALRHE